MDSYSMRKPRYKMSLYRFLGFVELGVGYEDPSIAVYEYYSLTEDPCILRDGLGFGIILFFYPELKLKNVHYHALCSWEHVLASVIFTTLE
ncbi:hypothetical protein QVD17_21489 [Tagetes erecta]|uniref:Uncharacterized protein n=1 Tax=Tagetes erecta TaxID=13708 RepID=A0AAD8NT62_TARER|nr:hypothetical protein QVD17_21489 [Tagetes erecta]